MNYSAFVVGDGVEGGMKSGELKTSENSLSFTSESLSLKWSISQLKIEVGGTNNKLIYLKSGQHKNIVLACRDLALLDDPVFQQGIALEKVNAVKKTLRKGRLNFGAILLFVVLILGTLLYNRQAIVSYIAKQVPFSVEQSIGAPLFELIQTNNNIVDDSLLNSTLSEVLRPILAVVEDPTLDFRFHIVEDTVVNAFALPGGDIVINTGLLLKADNWSEVQGVMAHEMGHIIERHHVRKMIGQVSLTNLLWYMVGDISVLSAVLNNMVFELEDLKYSRALENEADEQAWVLLDKANLDPHGLVTFFEKLSNEHNHGGFFEALWSTHPLPADRAERINKRIEKVSNSNFNKPIISFKSYQLRLKTHITDNQ